MTLSLFLGLAHAAEVALVGAALVPTALQPGSTCPSCWDSSGTVEVANLAVDKDVEVWFSTDERTWEVLDAAYDGPATDPGRERWSFAEELGYVYPQHVRFAVRYEVAGQVYWDNNGGIDFVVTPEGLMAGDPVELASVERGTGLGCYGQCADLEVFGRVQDLAYDKRVQLVYRVDGGAIVRLPMQYSGASGSEHELWRAYLPYIYPRDAVVELGLLYRARGVRGAFTALDGGQPFVR